MPRATRKDRLGSLHSARGSRSSGGRRTQTSESTIAGPQRKWRKSGNRRKNWSLSNPNSFFLRAAQPLSRWCSKRAPFPSFSQISLIRSVRALSRACRSPAATSPEANLEGSIIGKYLELLKEIAPRVTKVALFYNPETATFAHIYLDRFKVAAETLGVKATTPQFRTMAELETIMAAQAREPNGGLIAMPDGFNTANRVPITSLAARYRLPAIYPTRPFADAGGLMSYGNVISDNYRRAASYVDRILKGERPSELPVQFPVKFELVINLKTARALGLDVPLFLQQRADEVIE
jgi:hypothetical protein